MTVVNGVLTRAEQDPDLRDNAVYVRGVKKVTSVPGCANLQTESPNAMIHPVELWVVGSTLVVSRQECRLVQGQEYQGG